AARAHALVDADSRAREGRIRAGRLDTGVGRTGDGDGAVQGARHVCAARDGKRRRPGDEDRRDDHCRRKLGIQAVMRSAGCRAIVTLILQGARRFALAAAVVSVALCSAKASAERSATGATPIVDNERVTVWDVTAADPNAPRPQGESVWISLV